MLLVVSADTWVICGGSGEKTAGEKVNVSVGPGSNVPRSIVGPVKFPESIDIVSE